MKKLIVQHRRGTKTDLEKVDITPRDGEIIVEKKSKYSKLKAGDGITPYSQLPYVTEEVETKLDGVAGRVSALEAGVGEPVHGSWESEVKDIRQGWDGITYPSAGDAVRATAESVDDLKKSLNQFIDADAVDGLLYENNMLQLTASGMPVGEPVEIKGGSGGGGSSSIKLRLTNLTPEGTNFSVTSQDSVKLSFLFTSTEDDIPTGDFTCTVEVGGIVRKTTSFSQSETGTTIDVTSYLKSDENKIRISCTDIYGNSRTIIYNINVIELILKSSFDSNKIYKDTAYPNGIDFRYTAIGLVDKTVYFIVDNKQVGSKFLGASTSGKEIAFVFPMNMFTHGVHRVEVVARAIIDEKTIESNTLLYDFMIHVEGETAPMIGSSIDFDETTQGELLTIPYIVYDPNDATCEIKLQIKDENGFIYSETSLVVDQTLQTWSIRKYPVGKDIQFSIIYAPEDLATPIVKTHHIIVNEALVNVEPESDALLELSAQGRSNVEANPAQWTSGSITTDFDNFNWKSNGWVQDNNGDTCLRVSGGARATINFAPLSSSIFNIHNSGLTIELEFAIRDVNNRDTVVVSCFDGQRGFELTADRAFMKSVADEVSCNYKDEDKIKLAFTIDKDGVTADGYESPRFLCVYLDGILSSIVRYTSTDFAHDNKILIGDVGCTLDLYTVRVYNRALTAKELTNNYIADVTDVAKKIELYDDNNIYSANGLLSYEAVKSKIPVVTFTGTMPKFKGDKRVVLMDFENPFDASKNFKNVYGGPIQVLVDVQGTSSQWYVRKNWKIKLKDKKNGINNPAFQHMDDQLPSQVFCLKVDYAEATGTHNTQNANLIETLYTEQIPPQADDSRVRTTVVGFPCVIFEKETEDSDPVFSSKANFNIDKGSEDSFGFNEDYSVESWEFLNNTSNVCNFLEPIDSSKYFLDDFEPRYITSSEADDYTIDDLEEMEDKYQASIQEGGTPLTDEETKQLLAIREGTIRQFKELHDWVVSVKDDPVKFKNEFEDHFDLSYSLVYYIYTFFALMTDQRSKNMFLTRWTTTDVNGNKTTKWYPYFYDNDTCFGINNEGYLTFDYYHEDIDQVNNVNVFNGQNNALWVNFRKAYQQEIAQTYRELRNGRLTYDKIINQFITEGSSSWSESIYNEDIEYKYVTMARPENSSDGKVDTSNLYQVRGNGEAHLKYFIQNRLNYCDSKWNSGDYPNNFISMRINTPTATGYPDGATDEEKAEIDASREVIKKSIEVVPPSPVITVTPYSNMYCGVKYKANGTIEQKRATKNTPVSFGTNISEVFNDTEAGIFGASELSSVGDLSALYLRTLITSSATKLTDLQIGNHIEGYNNTMLDEIQVGNNKLLRRIDVTNCSKLTNPLAMSGCSNIEEIYALGTSITGVELPSSGYVKVLHIPNTIRTLTITNHPNLTDDNLIIGSGRELQNILTLNIANCYGLNTTQLLDDCFESGAQLERVRLTDVLWNNKSTAWLQNLYKPKSEGGYGLKGIDANNQPTDTLNISGTCILNENVSGELMADLVKNLPYISFKMGDGYKVTSTITFMNNDGTKVLWTETLSTSDTSNITCPDPVIEKHISTPTRESTPQFSYTWSGWSIQPAIDRVPQEDALRNIVGNRTLYPAFTAVLRSYTISFFTGANILYETSSYYGTIVSFDHTKVSDKNLLLEELDGDIVPKNADSLTPESYEFIGWFPSLDIPVTGVTKYSAQFYLNDSEYYNIPLQDINYTLENNNLTITKYKNNNEPLVDIPDTYTIPDQGEFTTTEIIGYSDVDSDITGFSNTLVESVRIPDSVTTIGEKAFYNVSNLSNLNIGSGVTEIHDYAFNNNKKLTNLYFNACNAKVVRNRTSVVNSYPFDNMTSERGVDVTIGPDVERINENMFYQSSNDKTNRAINTLDFSSATNCTYIGTLAFSNTNISNLILSSNIKFIGSAAFDYNTSIEELRIPNGVEQIDVSAFMQWKALKKVVLPSSTVLSPGAFRYDENIETFECDDASRYKFESGCLIDKTNNQLVYGTFNAEIPETVNSLANYSFAGCTRLTSITLPDSITYIPTDAFAGCSNLVDVQLGNNITTLGQSAFYQCTNLKSVVLPDSLVRINILAFGLSAIETLRIPASVKQIELNPFLNCHNLTAVYILNPDGVSVSSTVAGVRELFTGCENLKDIYVSWDRGAVDGEDYCWNAPGGNIESGGTVTIHYNYKET